MANDPAAVIAQLKQHLGVETDAELARSLRIDKTTISSWKRRGRVPQRFLDILSGDSSLAVAVPLVKWAPHEQAAMSLALFRYARLYGDLTKSADFPALMSMLTRKHEIWDLFRQAQWDLLNCMEQEEQSLSGAIAIILHGEIADADNAIERDRRLVYQSSPSIEWSDGSVTHSYGPPLKRTP